ncbi:MAG: hypothetical protein C0444_01805 [Microbacterium sp.]|nr:hypothetical protein [Microbacterium sp.]MBA4345687.1 hypothetical protein [Microbacterium sp.]
MLPRTLRPDLRRILPNDPRTYDGPLLAVWLLGAYLLVIVARSLVHLFAPDGGASSIATIDINVEGGANIVAIFGQWGAIQLLLALVLVTLLVRYRGLTPFIALVLAVEPLLRMLAGSLKPVETLGTAPGAALNEYMGFIMVIVLWLSICPVRSRA